jgi:hypothetical protein
LLVVHFWWPEQRPSLLATICEIHDSASYARYSLSIGCGLFCNIDVLPLKEPFVMMHLRFARRSTWFAAVGLVWSTLSFAQSADTPTVREGNIGEDVYVAGDTVRIDAEARADVIAAGRTVTVGRFVGGDVIAAGGMVSVRAKVADDVRVAGGDVTIDATIGDGLIAAGGNVTMSPSTAVGGSAWVAGGNLSIAGKIGKSLRATGATVALAGHVAGDAHLVGDRIEIGSGTVIGGNLRYRSGSAIQIAPGAKIAGTVTQEATPPVDPIKEGTSVFRVGYYLSLMVTGVVLFLLFPLASVGAAQRIQWSPFTCLGLGLALLLLAPLAILLLFATVAGVWLALSVLALYFVMLLVGYLIGVIFIGDIVLRRLRKRRHITKQLRSLSIVGALVALWLIGFIPVIGALACFATLVYGVGALMHYTYERYTGH